jgi:putative addiction module component (TIGR02574 family)
MTDSARKLLEAVLSLSEDERLEVASQIIASVDGPGDADWDRSWLAELDRRVDSARESGEVGAEWSDARSRILRRLVRE